VTVVLWIVAGAGVLCGWWAIRRVAALAKELHGLKSEQREAQARLKRIAEEIQETAEPLRLQLAKVAGGGTVSREAILSGRRYLTVSASEAQRLYEGDRDRSLLVDVRTAKEFAIRRAAGATLVPLEELERRYEKDIPESMGKVFIYCAGGDRSRLACDFLSRKGYTNLYHVRDGLPAWSGPTEGEGPLTLIQIERNG
jgi:rhodanese-related sulfurtransferase